MRIAVDAMGGDYAPRALIEGVLACSQAEELAADLILIGDEGRIREILEQCDKISCVPVVHAPETIGMGESGPIALRKKREASLSVAMRLLADSRVDAVVSAGNSGAIVATARHFVGAVPGVRRPSLIVPLPAAQGEVHLADAGAYPQANPYQLAQSAALAHAYLKIVRGIERPRLGLLNVGHEPVKGTPVIRRAFTLLERSSLHFWGNVEPQDVVAGRVHGVICDGFTGNICLKFFESLYEAFAASREGRTQTAGAGLEKEPFTVREQRGFSLRYQQVGGAPLLGIRKAVVVAHGRSDAQAISSAIRVTSRLVENNAFEDMARDLVESAILADLKQHYAQRMLKRWKDKWGRGSKVEKDQG